MTDLLLMRSTDDNFIGTCRDVGVGLITLIFLKTLAILLEIHPVVRNGPCIFPSGTHVVQQGG